MAATCDATCHGVVLWMEWELVPAGDGEEEIVLTSAPGRGKILRASLFPSPMIALWHYGIMALWHYDRIMVL